MFIMGRLVVIERLNRIIRLVENNVYIFKYEKQSVLRKSQCELNFIGILFCKLQKYFFLHV